MAKKRSTLSPSDPLLEFHKQVDLYPEYHSKAIKELVAQQRKMLKIYDYLPERGAKAVAWIERMCVLVEGERAGEPVKLLLWMKWLICSIFCFWGNFEVEQFDNYGNLIGVEVKYLRVVNDVLLVIATGNAKTSFLAQIIEYCLYSSEFPAPKIYIGSNSYDQSRLCFDTVLSSIEHQPILKDYADLRPSKGEIEVPKTGGKLKAMSSRGTNFEGIVPCVILIDEIHGMATSEYAHNLRKSTKRDDTLVIETTTQGTVRGGYLDERVELARNTLAGNTSEPNYRQLFVLFEQDDEQEIFESYESGDIGVLRKSNPSIGTTVSPTLLKGKVQEMKNDPSKRTINLTKNFNIPQNPETSYFSKRECQTKPFDESIFNGAPVFFGFDMAYTRSPESDLACLTMLMVDPETRREYSKDFYFLPELWEHQATEGNEIKLVRECMIRNKSRVDSNINYNPRQKKYGYQKYIDRGDMILVNRDLCQELKEITGQEFDVTGITEQFILAYLAKLQRTYNFIPCKFGLDPNKASEIESFVNANIYSWDGNKPAIRFQIEKKTISNPIIEDTKDVRARGLVYNNNRLTELHFAAAQAKIDNAGYIVFTNTQAQRKDGVIAHLAARSAYKVFTTVQDKGVQNMAMLTTWWSENRERINAVLEG